ncbi:hypothetical protein EBU95_18775 [bacterium]|nr:hypothetical protein [bacterium]
MSNQPQILAYIKEKIVNTQFFSTQVKHHKIVACFGTESYGELTKYMFKKYQADVAILVDLKSKSVVATKRVGSDFNLETFAKLCDGKLQPTLVKGVITEKFTELTKRFLPC